MGRRAGFVVQEDTAGPLRGACGQMGAAGTGGGPRVVGRLARNHTHPNCCRSSLLRAQCGQKQAREQVRNPPPRGRLVAVSSGGDGERTALACPAVPLSHFGPHQTGRRERTAHCLSVPPGAHTPPSCALQGAHQELSRRGCLMCVVLLPNRQAVPGRALPPAVASRKQPRHPRLRMRTRGDFQRRVWGSSSPRGSAGSTGGTSGRRSPECS